MLVLFETAAGFALFKVLNDKKLKDVDVSIFSSINELGECSRREEKEDANSRERESQQPS